MRHKIVGSSIGSSHQRLLRFWVKAPDTNSEIGTTRLARARARGIVKGAKPAAYKVAARKSLEHADRKARSRQVGIAFDSLAVLMRRSERRRLAAWVLTKQRKLIEAQTQVERPANGP